MSSARRIALVLLAGCGRVAFDPLGDGGSDGSVAQTKFWGDYAATLPVPACTGPELLVTDTSDSLDGGTSLADAGNAGPTLSLVEAMTIANNRAGRDVIRFDASVFPVDAPATITIGPTATPPFAIDDTCLDGRSRGVIVDWADCTVVSCPHGLINDSLLIGVTYINTLYELMVTNAQVAGVRLGTDGVQNLDGGRLWTLEIDGTGTADVGPGNVIVANAYAFRIFGGDAAIRIHDNFIGYDPLTNLVIPTSFAFDMRVRGTTNDVLIQDNVIAVTGQSVDVNTPVGYRTVFATNRFGAELDGTPLPGAFAGVRLINSTWQLQFNQFTNVGIAMLFDVANVLAIGNQVASSTAVIEYTTAPPIAPPAITSASVIAITGTCAGDLVDVFADPGVLAASWLGTAPCSGGTFELGIGGQGLAALGLNALATQSTSTSTSELSVPVPFQ